MAEIQPTVKKNCRNHLEILVVFIIIALMFFAIFGVFYIAAKQREKQVTFHGDVMRQRQDAWERGATSNFKPIEKENTDGSPE